jgi:hypothetical protein
MTAGLSRIVRTEAYMSAAISIIAAREESIESLRVSTRYKDAYREARVIVGIGKFIKFLGCVVGGLTFFYAVVLANPALDPLSLPLPRPERQTLSIALMIFAVIATVHFWIGGVLVCSWGQHLEAGLDSAVNSSPFLSNAQRARAMSID